MHSIGSWEDFQKSLNLEQPRDVLRDTRYQVIQSNGQRIYSPSSSTGIPAPPKGTEIFIGNLPHDLFEDELIPIFSRRGPIYNVRIMLDFFGRNRGYAFISYFRVEDAHAAVVDFNNYKIRNRTRIAVCISVDNRRLFIGNIPKDRTSEEIKFVLQKYVEGIVAVILYNEPLYPRLNRGFVFVEFQNHRLAAIARRHLAPGNLVIWGQAIFVDWAEPLPIVNPQILKNVTKLYLSNIPIVITSSQLKNILYDLLGTDHILKVHKIDDYAFVHFTIRKQAEEAFQRLRGLVIMGNVIGVEWARPIEYSRSYRLGKIPENFCRSVPPNMRRLVQQSIAMRKMSKQNCYASSVTESSGSDYCTTDILR